LTGRSIDRPRGAGVEAIAGGAVLALVAHAMIPEAIEDAGSAVVMPTVGGFLFGLYLSLTQAFGP
jgi:hypothetical protein